MNHSGSVDLDKLNKVGDTITEENLIDKRVNEIDEQEKEEFLNPEPSSLPEENLEGFKAVSRAGYPFLYGIVQFLSRALANVEISKLTPEQIEEQAPLLAMVLKKYAPQTVATFNEETACGFCMAGHLMNNFQGRRQPDKKVPKEGISTLKTDKEEAVDPCSLVNPPKT